MDHQMSNSSDVVIPIDGPINAVPPFEMETFEVIHITLKLCIIGTISFFGIIANCMNMIVFFRQGILSHSCTVNLTALAVSDLCYCTLNVWASVIFYFKYFVDQKHYRFDAFYMYLFTAGRPSLMVTDVTSWVTAFVAFERLISVLFPFKVKIILSPKRSCIVVLCIIIAIFAIHIPNMFLKLPGWVEVSPNFTILVFYRLVDVFAKATVDKYIRIILRVVVMATVLLCNIIISWKVNISKTFRMKLTNTESPNDVGEEAVGSKTTRKGKSYKVDKELKLSRMVTVIGVMFIACYTTDLIVICVLYLSGLKVVRDFHWTVDWILRMVVDFSRPSVPAVT